MMKAFKYIPLSKKIKLIILFSWMICATAFTQVLRPNLVVSSRPTAYLAEWYRPQNGMLVISTGNGATLDKYNIRLETELINSDGQLVYKLPFQQSAVFALSGAVINFTLDNIIQLQNGNFNSSALNNSFSNGGKLAAGQYSIRIKIWDAVEGIERSEWTPSKIFHILNYQLPQLMQPADGKALEVHQANSFVTFRWTPLTPTLPQSAVSYRIQIWQVLTDQTPMQTMRSAPPIEDRMIKGSTQFIWQPRLNMVVPEPAATNQFIWTIQTLDEKEMPVETADASTQGISQPYVFSFSNKTQKTDTTSVK